MNNRVPTPADAISKQDAEALAIIAQINGGYANRPPKATTGKRMITARLTTAAIDGLEQTARRLGYIHAGHGNVSMLLEAIGTGTVHVTLNVLDV